jgi:hypothetical protein
MAKKNPTKKARKDKFPEMLFVRKEYDGNDKTGDGWFVTEEQLGSMVDKTDWQNFAVYKRVGTGRGRLSPKPEVEGDKQVRVAIAKHIG